MKRFFLWQFMINKRLLHKRIFVLLLVLVPLLVWGMSRISEEDSGILTILISMEDAEDEIAGQVVEAVLQDDSILYYEVVEPKQAYQQVAAGQADCAWIFREDFQEKLISTFAKDEVEAPVYVVAQEDTVALQLARTKLYAFVYPQLASLICEHFMENEIPGVDNLSAKDLQDYYEKYQVQDSLFQMIYEETIETEPVSDQSYLMLPIRGILVIFLLIGGLVVTLYYLQDEERGMFAWIPVPRRRGLRYCYLFAACLDMSVVVVLSLLISEGRWISPRELGILAIYLFTGAVFCELMKLLCRTGKALVKWIPLVTLAMLGLCPVFLDLGSSFALQYLFPPTYYLRALHSNRMLWIMVGYTMVLFVVETVWWKLVQQKEQA